MGASFHVILATFVDPVFGSDQVEWETWDSDNQNWQICMGPLILQSSQESSSDQHQFSLQISPLLDRVRIELLPTLSPGLHWLRLYLMQLDGRLIASEALLDNADWTKGRILIEACEWPPQNFSARLFLTLHN